MGSIFARMSLLVYISATGILSVSLQLKVNKLPLVFHETCISFPSNSLLQKEIRNSEWTKTGKLFFNNILVYVLLNEMLNTHAKVTILV